MIPWRPWAGAFHTEAEITEERDWGRNCAGAITAVQNLPVRRGPISPRSPKHSSSDAKISP